MKAQLNLPIVAMNYPVALIRLLEEQGVSVENSLKNTGLCEAILAKSDKLITPEQCIALISNALRLTEKQELGLLFGNSLSINSHGVFGMALLSCRTLDGAFELLERFISKIFPFSVAKYNKGESHSFFEMDIGSVDNIETAFVLEMLFSCIYSTVKLLTGGSMPGMVFEFSGKRPENVQMYKRFLGENIRFDREWNRIVLPSTLRDAQLRFYEPVTLRMAIKQCDSILGKMSNPNKMELRVKGVISGMSVPFPDIEAVASELNMCSRTVRRKLKLEGVTYQELLDEKRKKIAIKYLTETEMTITQISSELYFSDSSYFSRAFKRWTGVLPRNYRRGVSVPDV